ncbi:hypothetical protein C0J52_10594 [Blattella germanica]|nr:hypothetical protein C0J52_10594 [Blattella germanica]
MSCSLNANALMPEVDCLASLLIQGWNDVSFHGSAQIPTPNIDALAYNGIILNSHYVPALCTPSRSSLMTGKYPTHTGMQHLVILAPEPWGLPLKERLMPQHLKEAGYATHAVGKWHLGFHRKEYTPTYRGFDTHYGYDMRRNMSIDWDARGKYSTDLFTDEAVNIINTHNSEKGPLFLYLAHLAPHTGNPEEPFQAPDEEIAKFAHIEDPERRMYAGMDVRKLGNIDGIDMWKVLSENTASPRLEVLHNIDPIEEYAAIRRGDWKYITGTTQEGRVDEWYGESGYDNPQRYDTESVLNSKAGVAITGFITKLQVLEKKLIRMAENQTPGKANINIKPEWRKMKLLTETTITKLRHQAQVHCNQNSISSAMNKTNISLETACRPMEAPCLFNIRDDPCETINLASTRPLVLHSLEESLERFRNSMVKPLNIPGDPMANPIHWNNTWVNWKDDSIPFEEKISVFPFTGSRGGSMSVLILLSIMISLSIIGVVLKFTVSTIPEKSAFFAKFLQKSAKEIELNDKQKSAQ